MHEFLSLEPAHALELIGQTLAADYRHAGGRSRLTFEPSHGPLQPPRTKIAVGAAPSRQSRHLNAS